MYADHPIVYQSFAVIDQEVGRHHFTADGYTILRRVIHSTADFEFKHTLRLSEDAIDRAVTALQQGVPIITDVGMVGQGIRRVVAQTFRNPVVVAVEQAKTALPGKTLTETGLLSCCQTYPTGLYVIGNAPTALLALCDQIENRQVNPSCVVGVPVGFINVLESKQRLAQLTVPQIRIEGRKGGSGVAAAILNALIILAWNRQQQAL